MLKLMEASDNSAEGFGQVVATILNQTGLSPEEFCSRLQLIDGDLGTSKNFNSIRALRTPSKLIMGTENQPINDSPPKIATEEWNATVEACYKKFFSPEARQATSKENCPKLHALLFRLHDFSTVVEANRAMKAGDVGRLMNIWKIWSIMSQALPGLVNYRSYLPRMVLLLQNILPPSLRKYILHTLLISPSGQENHFVAKDYYLELQNYSLKYFYNRTGAGTQVERLREMFSMNMNLPQDGKR
ncbi:uncharacterized protein PGTG_21509 [Puccinia graminis f. sp. tritici CRL 75-36-700-3]|uniref:DUF6589 domain-containing protein n=1 Tax=Puccinia graminis f. sp. tritici (strain CRL 75-36-700-3 / race SCCL) TaxID=418459 RepID=H6QRI5_PUCGT|nr:uncharacterized protein PGTG_21509 [Puccinia graminis f. sp. tritici CRL 75-36-700-3]EHS63293.1 hypothetical protein PGTG_21509 [Puccinia graminis f. sp. tritici CRL 75-36-700-3]